MSEPVRLERVIGYDVTRLFLGPLSPAPRGIDRVDVALARHLFEDPRSHHLGILPTPWGVRTYDAATVRAGLAYLQGLWAELGEGKADPQETSLHSWVAGRGTSHAAGRERLSLAAKSRRLLGEVAATGFAFGHPVRSGLPHGAVYCNLGQIALAVPRFHAWLDSRPDVTAVFMLHDVIPLEHPELVEPASIPHHRRMVETVARHGDGLVVTTQHARDTVTLELSTFGRERVPTHVRRLPLPEAFAAPHAAPAALASCSFFVACATIEPRKNLGLLLSVWRRLASRLGSDTPKLVIAGSPGWRAEKILRPLVDDPLLRTHVRHVMGLSSPALARLMLSSAGVLCPSLAEGFGLPLLEANALGVPAIASDIPSHREIATASTILLAPDDVEGWEAAVLAPPISGSGGAPAKGSDLTEAAYAGDIVDFLALCASRKA